METQHENSAADAHMQVAEKLDRVEGSVQKALDDIQDISRGSREKIGDETDGKSLPSESEMEQAVDVQETPIAKRKGAKLNSSPIGADSELCGE